MKSKEKPELSTIAAVLCFIELSKEPVRVSDIERGVLEHCNLREPVRPIRDVVATCKSLGLLHYESGTKTLGLTTSGSLACKKFLAAHCASKRDPEWHDLGEPSVSG
jgi:hypothetical protein